MLNLAFAAFGAPVRALRASPALALLAALQFFAESAAAHITLMDPPARYPGASENKACPCGVGTSNRTCRVEGERSDPNRSDRITMLRAGETIVVRFNETVGHAGRYRVALDLDGADLEDFNANVLLDVPDPPGRAGNLDDGTSIWELSVTIPPGMSCDNCTLQLIQMMNGNMEDPVADPVGLSTYYQCADIVVVDAEGEGGGAGGEGASDESTSGEGAPSGADTDAGVELVSNPPRVDDASCSASGRAATGGASLAWLALGVLAYARRRREVA